jgi:hypothetical protein
MRCRGATWSENGPGRPGLRLSAFLNRFDQRELGTA